MRQVGQGVVGLGVGAGVGQVGQVTGVGRLMGRQGCRQWQVGQKERWWVGGVSQLQMVRMWQSAVT